MSSDNAGSLGTSCILCGEAARPFFEIPSVPVNTSQLYEDGITAANALTGRIAMASCDYCGAYFNASWNSALMNYDGRYENSLDASPTFGEYSISLAQRLSTSYQLTGLRVVEIGCGQARFLRTISEIAGCEGFGFDPSYIGPEKVGHIRVQRRLCQPEDTASAAMVICRHVLEHFDRPREFLLRLARVAECSPATTFYFEVPNAEVIFSGGIPWDIIYPHVSYFTARSLTLLFTRCGFRVLDAGTAYAGQFLYIEARVDTSAKNRQPRERDAEHTSVDRFPTVLSSVISGWARKLRKFRTNGIKVAFWGAGAKGVTFLNTVPGARDISCVVDLNPRKQGTFVPGTGQLISPPDSLRGFKPDVIITPNPIYAAEIRTRLAEMDSSALVLTKIDPSSGAGGKPVIPLRGRSLMQ